MPVCMIQGVRRDRCDGSRSGPWSRIAKSREAVLVKVTVSLLSRRAGPAWPDSAPASLSVW